MSNCDGNSLSRWGGLGRRCLRMCPETIYAKDNVLLRLRQKNIIIIFKSNYTYKIEKKLSVLVLLVLLTRFYQFCAYYRLSLALDVFCIN